MTTIAGLQYIGGSIFLSLFILLPYFQVANKFGIIDKPNLRSSHSAPTIRGGGIVFFIITILSGVLGFIGIPTAVGISLAGLVGFWDDIRPLSPLPRLIVHILAWTSIAWGLQLFDVIPYWALIIGLIVAIGWVNAFNFMDGINGITVLYALVFLITVYLSPDLPIDSSLLLILIGCCLAFAFFNARKKAVTFAGDVGSISLAFIMGYIMLTLLLQNNNLAYLFLWLVYGLDSLGTIVIRLARKENILKAHRSHLYQLLGNEKQLGHLPISFAYALIQAVVNLVVVLLIIPSSISLIEIVILALVSFAIYFLVRKQIDTKPLFQPSTQT